MSSILEVDICHKRYGLWRDGIKQVGYLANFMALPSNGLGIIGLTEWQGRVVPVIHLGLCLGYRVERTGKEQIIWAEYDNKSVALMIDEVIAFSQVEPDKITADIGLPATKLETIVLRGAYIKDKDKEIIPILGLDFLSSWDEAFINEFQYYWEEQKNQGITPIVETGKVAPSKNESLLSSSDRVKSKDIRADHNLYIVIRLGHQPFALPMSRIERIVSPLPGLVRLPFATPPVLGSFNYKGQVVLLFSIGKDSEGDKAVIFKTKKYLYGILVDDIIGTSGANMGDIFQQEGEYSRYALRWQDQVIPIVEIDQLTHSSSIQEE